MSAVVILDTTTLSKALGLGSADWLRLLSLSETKLIELIVPELVLMEAGRQWEERFHESSAAINAAHDKRAETLQDFGLESSDRFVESHNLSRSSYVSEKSAVLSRYKARVAPLPATSVRQLVELDLDRRKPFSGDGKGFRDALIWETVVELSNAEVPPIFFVSNNTKDFCNGQGKLHEHLVATLNDSSPVEHVRSLKELLETEPLQGLVKQLNKIQDTLTEELLMEKVDESLAELLYSDFEELTGEYIGKGEWELPAQILLDSPVLTHFELEDSSLTCEVFRGPEPGELVVEAEITTYCQVEGYFYKSEWWLAESDDVIVLDGDWNNHMSHAAQELKVQFRFVGESEPDTLKDVKLSLDHAEVLNDTILSH